MNSKSAQIALETIVNDIMSNDIDVTELVKTINKRKEELEKENLAKAEAELAKARTKLAAEVANYFVSFNIIDGKDPTTVKIVQKTFEEALKDIENTFKRPSKKISIRSTTDDMDAIMKWLLDYNKKN